MATFEIFAHLDVVGRQGWNGDPEDRPLTDAGRRQAEKLADEILAAGPVDGVYASDNTRCRQSVEPIARRSGVEVKDATGFSPAPKRADGAEPLATAYQAGAIFADLMRIQATRPDGRYVICSNGGDLISSIMAFGAGVNHAPIPAKLEVSIGSGSAELRRGNVYTLVINGAEVAISQRVASPDFPQAVEAHA